MADELSFSVDSDWKKQAQEEKRRLAEEAQRQKAAPTQSPSPAPGAATAAGVQPSQLGTGRRQRAAREDGQEANFLTLVQMLAAQALAYMGGVATAGGEAMVDLDTAKQQIDLMAILEEKTRGNLMPEEQAMLDTALYETRMRYVGTASRYIL